MNQNQQTKLPRFPRIKKGDEVVVISGTNKGKTGRVLAVYPTKMRVLVEGVNIVKRSYKRGAPNSGGMEGIHEKGMPIHVSNVMLMDPKSGAPTRVGIEMETNKDGKVQRSRYAKASGTIIKD